MFEHDISSKLNPLNILAVATKSPFAPTDMIRTLELANKAANDRLTPCSSSSANFVSWDLTADAMNVAGHARIVDKYAMTFVVEKLRAVYFRILLIVPMNITV